MLTIGMVQSAGQYMIGFITVYKLYYAYLDNTSKKE